MNKLTNRQKRFVEEYLIDLNARQAAIRAGYSPKTAQEQASRLLANVKVQTAISAFLADISSAKIADGRYALRAGRYVGWPRLQLRLIT